MCYSSRHWTHSLASRDKLSPGPGAGVSATLPSFHIAWTQAGLRAKGRTQWSSTCPAYARPWICPQHCPSKLKNNRKEKTEGSIRIPRSTKGDPYLSTGPAPRPTTVQTEKKHTPDYTCQSPYFAPPSPVSGVHMLRAWVFAWLGCKHGNEGHTAAGTCQAAVRS